jgi:hypothetical protein
MQMPLLPGTRKFASMLKFGDAMRGMRGLGRGMSSVPSPSGSGAVGSAGRIFDVTGANFPQVVDSRYRNKRRKSAREIKSGRKSERHRERERERDSLETKECERDQERKKERASEREREREREIHSTDSAPSYFYTCYFKQHHTRYHRMLRARGGRYLE